MLDPALRKSVDFGSRIKQISICWFPHLKDLFMLDPALNKSAYVGSRIQNITLFVGAVREPLEGHWDPNHHVMFHTCDGIAVLARSTQRPPFMI